MIERIESFLHISVESPTGLVRLYNIGRITAEFETLANILSES